jgi:hypothetical protein
MIMFSLTPQKPYLYGMDSIFDVGISISGTFYAFIIF